MITETRARLQKRKAERRARYNDQSPPPPPKPTDWLRMIVPVLVLGVFVFIAWREGYFDLNSPQKLTAAAHRAQGMTWLGPIFVAVYAGLAAIAAPVSPLAYGAGAVFGLARGSTFVMIASTIGAAAGYVMARGVWAGPARRILGRYRDKMRALRDSNVFLTTLRLQLLPIMPFGVFNYAAGAARLRFIPFMGGTIIGILPGTLAAVYVGDRLMAGIAGSDKRAFIVAAVVMAALLGLSFLPTALKKLHRTQDTRNRTQ